MNARLTLGLAARDSVKDDLIESLRDSGYYRRTPNHHLNWNRPIAALDRS